MKINLLKLFNRGPRPLATGAPISMVVLLNEMAPLEPDDLLARLFARTGLRHKVDRIAARRSGDVVSFPIGGERATVTLRPSRYPWHELEGPCATAWWWPEALRSCEAARAHAVVTLEGGSDDLTDRFLRLSDVAAATAEATRAVAIYCPSGTVVQPADNFLRSAAKASEDALPLHLWVEFRKQEIAPGTTFIATTGLATFGHREVEAITRHPGREAHHRVFNFADCLMRGRAPQPGEAWELEPGDQIGVRIAKSQWARDPVWRLDFAGDPAPRK